MTSKTPYLIQRLERLKVDGKLDTKRFGEVWGLDYMGSSEYEFGAFAKFLRNMNAVPLLTFTVTIRDKKVFGVYDSTKYGNIDEVESVLNGIANNDYRLKERSCFPPDGKYDNCTGWADIVNNLFWSYENMSDAIVTCIKKSVEYMDSRK